MEIASLHADHKSISACGDIVSNPDPSLSRSAGCIASPHAIHPALREREGSGFETSGDIPHVETCHCGGRYIKNAILSFYIMLWTIIGASRSEPHTNHLYEKIAVLMHIISMSRYVVHVFITRTHAHAAWQCNGMRVRSRSLESFRFNNAHCTCALSSCKANA